MNKYEERFHAKYVPVPESGCWLWEEGMTATSRPSGGYGLFWPGKELNNGKQIAAHRYSYFLANGYLPSKEEHVMHKCDVPACVNPAHLKLGDHATNMRDRANKNRVNAVRKLSPEDAANAIIWLKTNPEVTISSVAKFYGMSPSHMGRIVKRYRRTEQ